MAPCRLTNLGSSCEPLEIPPPSPRWLRLRHREPNAPQRSGGGGRALGPGTGAARDRRSAGTQPKYFGTLSIAGSRVDDLVERETNQLQHHHQDPSLSSCPHHSLPPTCPHALPPSFPPTRLLLPHVLHLLITKSFPIFHFGFDTDLFHCTNLVGHKRRFRGKR